MSVKEKKLLTVPLRVLDAGTGKKNAGKVEMTTLRTLLDTGADENFIDVAVANRMGIRSQTDCNQDESDKVLVEMANGNRIQSLGAMTLKFAIGSRFRGSAKFYIIPLQHTEAILSSHWLHVQDALISMGDWTVQVPGHKKSMITACHVTAGGTE
uniref:Peptidase A2 domain-containing protein n=1 Tax=Hanusia phi TaxID=3032 RepID=A0A7S0HU92_9CRYP|mmetsp:Transcript_34064/g.76682  ORF Transcript_34064/g.76682 Transcript_34064/m.76682 type:complete len:155 (+) Transcript_34064:1356-1820(+)